MADQTPIQFTSAAADRIIAAVREVERSANPDRLSSSPNGIPRGQQVTVKISGGLSSGFYPARVQTWSAGVFSDLDSTQQVWFDPAGASYNTGDIVRNCSIEGVNSDSLPVFCASGAGFGGLSGPTINVVTNVCPTIVGGNVTALTVEYTPITFPTGIVLGTPVCAVNPSACCAAPVPCNICGPTTPQYMQLVGSAFSTAVDSGVLSVCAMNGTNLIPKESTNNCIWRGTIPGPGSCRPNVVTVTFVIIAGAVQGLVTIYDSFGVDIVGTYTFTPIANNCCTTWTANFHGGYAAFGPWPSTLAVTGICSGTGSGSGSVGGSGGGSGVIAYDVGTTSSGGSPVASLTLANETFATGDLLIVGVDAGVSITSVKWNGIALTSFATQGALSGWYLSVASGATGSIVVTPSSSTPVCFVATKVKGLTNVLDQTGTGTGSTGPADSGPVGPTLASPEYCVAFAVAATVSYPAVPWWTWGGGFTDSGQFAQNAYGGTLIEGQLVLNTTATVDALVSGVVGWDIIVGTFK